MRKWLYSFISLAIILLVIGVFLPYFNGKFVENKFRNLVTAANNFSWVNIKIVNYDRHWFSADASLQVTPKVLKDSPLQYLHNPQINQLMLVSHIAHGPIIMDAKHFKLAQATINTIAELDAEQNTLLKRSATAGPVANIDVTVGLGGTSHLEASSKPLAYQDAENNINWQGLNLTAKISAAVDNISSDIELPGLDITTKNFQFKIAAFKSETESVKSAAGLWVDQSDLTLKNFAVKTQTQDIAVENVAAQLVATDKKNILDRTTTITADKFTINGETYSNNTISWSEKNVNQVLLHELQGQLQQIMLTEHPTLQQLATAFDKLTSIISKGVEFDVKQFDTNTPWGKFSATLKATFDPTTNQNPGILTLLLNSEIALDIKLDQKLILHIIEIFYNSTKQSTQTPADIQNSAVQLLADWQKTGKVIVDGKSYLVYIDVDYKNRQLLLNEKPIFLSTKS
ncbi:MAG: YdgA family protein [Gammaproteobacteria bacterium]|nr:YdgA family protein [Gammaproteobacteria bacterium]